MRTTSDAVRVEHWLNVPARARLPRAQGDGERQPGAVSDEVQLGGGPAAAAAQGMVRRLAEAPPGGRVFPRTRGHAVGPDGTAVDAPERPVDRARGVEVALERVDDAVPQPLARPAPEARRHRRPRAEPLGPVAPRAAGSVAAEHADENEPVVAGVRARDGLRGQQGRDARPLRHGGLMPVTHVAVRRNHRATLSHRP